MAEHVTFDGAGGQRLAGLLDVPDGEPTITALFAHCFTCGKDSIAAARIARALTARGAAVLRFDVTGLGESEGSFGEATFSMDVDDLVAAATFLRTRGGAPGLLVGHSLGGAAVLAAAARIPEVRAVATIGAPSDPVHVAGLLRDAVPALARDGRAEVQLGGRTFTVHQAFLDDLRAQPQRRRIEELGRALLVMHSPQDEIVGIDNAREIYAAARHPKSFVSLDGADHLLTGPDDAVYAAEVLAAWASRYLPSRPTGTARMTGPSPARAAAPVPGRADEPDEALPARSVVVRETGTGRFQQEVRTGSHRWLADEPLDAGGDDSGPGPYDLLLAALGACTSMTLRMYADRRGWHVGPIEVVLRHDRVRADDRDTTSGAGGWLDRVQRDIAIAGDLGEVERAALLRIADRCPVHRTLSREVLVETVLVAAAPAPV